MFGKKINIQNRRRHRRMPAYFLMKYRTLQDLGPVVANIKDISRSGVKFWTDQQLTEKDLIRVSVCIPPIDATIEALARVVRVRQAARTGSYYVAVTFLELSLDDQELLGRFIDDRVIPGNDRDLLPEEAGTFRG